MAMFQTGDQAERLDVQLKAVMGSIAGGKEASTWIQDFAKNTPCSSVKSPRYSCVSRRSASTP